MIVDASAIVAIMAWEADAATFMDRLLRAEARLTHPISIYEATMAMRRLNRIPIETAQRDVKEFLDIGEFHVVPLEMLSADLALETYSRYGRGHHPAKLNMGDCFSYAVAKLRGMPLLYKGNDFAKTDLA